MAWHMVKSFAEKFEEALAEKNRQDGIYGLRTLARSLADGDKDRVETIRRRLHKYRPPKGGGAAEVQPTAPTRWEIEDAMGLERDALAPDAGAVAATHDAAVADLGVALVALVRQAIRQTVVAA